MCPKIRKEYLKSLQCVWDFVGVESAYLGVDFFFLTSLENMLFLMTLERSRRNTEALHCNGYGPQVHVSRSTEFPKPVHFYFNHSKHSAVNYL